MTTYTSSLVTVQALSRRAIAATVLGSAVGAAYAVSRAWPAWAVVAAAVLPWVPGFAVGTARTYRHEGHLALFYVLAVTQIAHLAEHVAQVTQIHVLDRTGPAARGIVGALDVEWVHFTWNALVLAAVVLLLDRFRANPWLWASGAVAAWHVAEHTLMIAQYLAHGVPGHPGFLSRGGIVSGGLPLARPDLHMLYNLIETIPLVVGLVLEIRRRSARPM